MLRLRTTHGHTMHPSLCIDLSFFCVFFVLFLFFVFFFFLYYYYFVFDLGEQNCAVGFIEQIRLAEPFFFLYLLALAFVLSLPFMLLSFCFLTLRLFIQCPLCYCFLHRFDNSVCSFVALFVLLMTRIRRAYHSHRTEFPGGGVCSCFD